MVDINLGEGATAALFLALQHAGTPTVVVTGYDIAALPSRVATATVVQTPAAPHSVIHALATATRRHTMHLNASQRAILQAIADTDPVSAEDATWAVTQGLAVQAEDADIDLTPAGRSALGEAGRDPA